MAAAKKRASCVRAYEWNARTHAPERGAAATCVRGNAEHVRTTTEAAAATTAAAADDDNIVSFNVTLGRCGVPSAAVRLSRVLCVTQWSFARLLRVVSGKYEFVRRRTRVKRARSTGKRYRSRSSACCCAQQTIYTNT